MILPAHDCVTVLMAVRNGAQTLPAQLDSLAAQSHANWRLIASDDGSTDGSRAILQRFAATDRHTVRKAADAPSSSAFSLRGKAQAQIGMIERSF